MAAAAGVVFMRPASSTGVQAPRNFGIKGNIELAIDVCASTSPELSFLPRHPDHVVSLALRDAA